MVEKDKNIKILFKKIAEEAVTLPFTSLARCIVQIPYNVQMHFTIKLHSPKMGYNN